MSWKVGRRFCVRQQDVGWGGVGGGEADRLRTRHTSHYEDMASRDYIIRRGPTELSDVMLRGMAYHGRSSLSYLAPVRGLHGSAAGYCL